MAQFEFFENKKCAKKVGVVLYNLNLFNDNISLRVGNTVNFF